MVFFFLEKKMNRTLNSIAVYCRIVYSYFGFQLATAHMDEHLYMQKIC